MRRACILFAVGLLPVFGGCRGGTSTSPPVHLVQDMDFQPKLKAQSETLFEGWTDHRSMRLPVANTVDRRPLPNPLLRHKDQSGAFVKQNPLPLTEAVLLRGRDRFQIFCAVCHGQSGRGGNADAGHGMVGRRWPVVIPTFHYQEGKDATANRVAMLSDGEVYDVILNGKTTMPAYGARLSVDDRWSIIHYVRALQNLGRQ